MPRSPKAPSSTTLPASIIKTTPTAKPSKRKRRARPNARARPTKIDDESVVIPVRVPSDAKANSTILFNYDSTTYKIRVPNRLGRDRIVNVSVPSHRSNVIHAKRARNVVEEEEVDVFTNREETETEILRCLMDPTFPSFVSSIGVMLENVRRRSESMFRESSSSRRAEKTGARAPSPEWWERAMENEADNNSASL